MVDLPAYMDILNVAHNIVILPRWAPCWPYEFAIWEDICDAQFST